MADPPANMMTVDVEDWFHILDAKGAYHRDQWDTLDSRVEANTERILDLIAEAGARATFFVVGWVAVRHPRLIRRIADAGHELGSHSYWHELLRYHDRRSLRADLERSKKLLEDLSGSEVYGFRAPGASMAPESAWAFDVILEQGFRYDSSISPGYSSHGGFDSPFFSPHRVRCSAGELIEIPISTMGIGRRRIPYAGGGHLRLFPYPLIRLLIARENRSGRPANVYFHPREVDINQPRMKLSALRYFKYYVGLKGAEAKMRALLRDFRFVPIRAWLDEMGDTLVDRVLDVRESTLYESTRLDASRIPPSPPES